MHILIPCKEEPEHKPEEPKKDEHKTTTTTVHYTQPTEHKSTPVAPVPMPKPEETHAPAPVYPPTEHKTTYAVHEPTNVAPVPLPKPETHAPTYVPSAPVSQPGATSGTAVARPSSNATSTYTPVMYTGGASTTGALTGVGAMIAGFAAFLL